MILPNILRDQIFYALKTIILKTKRFFSFLNERRAPFTNFSFCPCQYNKSIHARNMRVISRAVALSRWKIEQKVGACGKCKFAIGIHSRHDYSHSIRRIPSFGFPAELWFTRHAPWTFASGFCCRRGRRTIEVFWNWQMNIQECPSNIID